MSVTTMRKTTPPAAVPAPTVVPFPMPWSGNPALAGCCPPGGMDKLLQCYCDIQAAQAFISAMMIDAINNNPAVTQAIIAAIEASGSSLPLIGVTNGTDAQPGQVGEWVLFEQNVNFTAAFQNQTVTMGILQPGDWDFWIYANCPSPVVGINMSLLPVPAGMMGEPQGFFITDATAPAEQVATAGPAARLLISVPTLIPILLLTNQSGSGPAAGTLVLFFSARRRR